MLFFLFPVGTSEPVLRRPWITYALVALNVLVFISVNIGLRFTQGAHAAENVALQWGYVPAQREPLTVVSHLFLHGGLLHLLGNIWFLLLFGRLVEDRLGSKMFAALYLLAGVGSVALQDFFTVGTMEDVTGTREIDMLARLAGRVGREMPLVGASGAVFGIMGALLAVALWAEFRFVWFAWVLIYFRGGTVKLISLFTCVYYVLWENLLPALVEVIETQDRGYSIGGIAFFGHLGGFATGLGIGLLVRHVFSAWLPPDPSARESIHDVAQRGRFKVHPARFSGHVTPEQRAVEHLLRLIHKGRIERVAEQYLEYLQKFPDLTLPPPQMCIVAEALSESHSDRPALEAFEKVLASATAAPTRERALLGLARLCTRDEALHRRGRQHIRELMDLSLEPTTRCEAEMLLLRMSTGASEPSSADQDSHLTREPEAWATGESVPAASEQPQISANEPTGQPAYVPEPIAPSAQGPEGRLTPGSHRPPRSLPPPRPAHIPDETEVENPVVAPATHAVVLTSRLKIDVPRVARIVARGIGRSLVDVAGQIAGGMGVVLETDSLITAHRVASLLNGNRLPAAVVDLSLLPQTWREDRLLSAALRGDHVHIATEAQEQEAFPIGDLIVVAHAEVPLRPVDPEPEIVCDLLTRAPPRRLRATQGEFQHATPEYPATLLSFVGLIGPRAWRAQRDAGIMQSLATNRRATLKFGSLGEFEALVRWLTLCAFTPGT